MPVRFLRSWGVYNAGEVAGFTVDAEAALIRNGVAEDATPPAPDSAPDDAPKARRAKGK